MSVTTLLSGFDTLLRGLQSHQLQTSVVLGGLTLLLLVMRIASGRRLPVLFHLAFLMTVVPATLAGATGLVSFNVAIIAGFNATIFLAMDEMYYALYPMFDVVQLVEDLVLIVQFATGRRDKK